MTKEEALEKIQGLNNTIYQNGIYRSDIEIILAAIEGDDPYIRSEVTKILKCAII